MTRDAYTGGRDAADVPPPARIPSGSVARPGARQPDPRVTDEDVYSAIGAYSIVGLRGGAGRVSHDCMRAALETTLEPTGLVGRAVAAELERIAHDHADGVHLDRFGAELLRGLADAWREGRR